MLVRAHSGKEILHEKVFESFDQPKPEPEPESESDPIPEPEPNPKVEFEGQESGQKKIRKIYRNGWLDGVVGGWLKDKL